MDKLSGGYQKEEFKDVTLIAAEETKTLRCLLQTGDLIMATIFTSSFMRVKHERERELWHMDTYQHIDRCNQESV